MKGKKILVVPLNWGLGHATRIIPVIKILKEREADVSISGSPAQIAVLESEFPDIRIVNIPYLKLKLAKPSCQLINYLIQVPRFFQQIRAEHKALSELLKKEHFDLVISDNCYGLWNKDIRSVIITHQLNLQVPRYAKFLLPLFKAINIKLLSKFSSCWVPDFPDPKNLSGRLSHPAPTDLNVSYIGLLSRFLMINQKEPIVPKSDRKKILFIISGPETQRTTFEKILKKESTKLNSLYDVTFIRGLPGMGNADLPEGWYNHVSSEEMRKLILQSDLVVCRSGYSSIMDLVTLKKPALLIATPGQPEQEYLARYLGSAGIFCCQKQNKIELLKGIKTIEKPGLKFDSISKFNSNVMLSKMLENILG